MGSEQIYIALNPAEHKQIRASILKAQVDILHLMKKITRVKRLKRERETAKHKLVQQYLVLLEMVEKLDELIPDTELPEELRLKFKNRVPKEAIQKAAKKIRVPKEPKFNKETESHWEDELLSVREQLKSLTEQ